jgi:Tol biopolymer transport system component
MKLAFVAAAAIGCYAAHAPSEVPCASNGSCPGAQVCDTSRAPPTCVESLSPPDRWQAPTRVVYAPAGPDDDVTLTADLLELYFNRTNDIYAMARPTVAAPWSAPAMVRELSTAARESTPELSPDGLTIYLSSDRPGSAGTDIWVATRPARTAPWSAPVLAAGLNSTETDRCAAPTTDPDLIVLASDRTGDYDIYQSRRTGGVWSTPVPIAAANMELDDDSAPVLASDGRTIYFFSDREGDSDLFEVALGTPRLIDELASSEDEEDPWVSPDQRHLFFVRDKALYEAVR